MSTIHADIQKTMEEHVASLRDYAKRVLVDDGDLAPDEAERKASRLRELVAIGSSFGLTESELVTLVYKDLFATRRTCDCRGCQARRSVAFSSLES